MTKQEKTITTTLTHNIIKKDVIDCHFSYLKILELLFMAVFVALFIPLYIGAYSMENKTLFILSSIGFLPIILLVLFYIGKQIWMFFCIVAKKYQIVTAPVSYRKEKYDIYASHLFTSKYDGLLVKRTHNLSFGKYNSFRLERHQYYRWSPMFELSDNEIFNNALIGSKHHLVMVGKTILMIYNIENFLLI